MRIFTMIKAYLILYDAAVNSHTSSRCIVNQLLIFINIHFSDGLYRKTLLNQSTPNLAYLLSFSFLIRLRMASDMAKSSPTGVSKPVLPYLIAVAGPPQSVNSQRCDVSQVLLDMVTFQLSVLLCHNSL